MSQKRTMPTKAKIMAHWNLTYNQEFTSKNCWGCGGNSQTLERAHLLAKCKGGADEEDNLILLCRICHVTIQEPVSDTIEEANHIKKLILEGNPFFKILYTLYVQKIQSGVYEKTDLSRLGISAEDLNKFKQLTK